MQIGPITIHRHRRTAEGLEIYPWQALTTDRLTPEVRLLVAKMARSECRSYLDELKEEGDTVGEINLESALEAMHGAYRERAHLVALLASMYPSHIGHTDPSCPEYAVVIIHFPTGQASWHIAPDDLDLFDHVRKVDTDLWDGHTTDQKYAAIDAYTRANAEGLGEVTGA